VSIQLRLNASRMYRRSAHATHAVPIVESNGEEDVRRLGPPIRTKGAYGVHSKLGSTRSTLEKR